MRPEAPLTVGPSLYLATELIRSASALAIDHDPLSSAETSARGKSPISIAEAVDRLQDHAPPFIMQDHAASIRQLAAYLLPACIAADQRRRRDERTAKGRAEMLRVLQMLSEHCVDIDTYLGSITAEELRDILTSHPDFPSELLYDNSRSRDEAELSYAPTSTSASEISNTSLIPTSIIPNLVLLARWFKSSFMRWIDPIPCPSCGGSTTFTASDSPSPDEAAVGGGRVEVHTCTGQSGSGSTAGRGCGGVRRFVRYNSVKTLVRTREGRCGEWAYLFYAICRVLSRGHTGEKSVGRNNQKGKEAKRQAWEARYVWNSEDHVWVEVWDQAEGRWIHVDPCEAAVDKPLLYDQGWGKKQSFCIATGPLGLEDVTRAYVSDWPACLTRRKAKGWNEKTLKLALLQMTISLRLHMSRPDRIRLDEMDRRQAMWMADSEKRVREAQEQEMSGRVSGPAEWRAARNELGSESSSGGENLVRHPAFKAINTVYTLSSPIDTYLLGQAERASGRVILTTGPSQTSAFFPDLKLNSDRSYRIRLTFRMESPDRASGADGMALVFRNEIKLGTGGFGLGYHDAAPAAKQGECEWAVEIDTYRSQDHANDPPTPHISLHSPLNAHHDCSLACTAPGQLPLLGDGSEWALEVVFDASQSRVYASFGAAGSSGRMPLWQTELPRGFRDAHGKWYVGVTAACGGLWQRHEVLGLDIEEIENEG